jgi:hypothetical protein
VLSVDILAVRVDMWGKLGVASGELEFAIEMRSRFEINAREAILESEERGIDVARATARITMWRGICQGSYVDLVELDSRSYPAVMMSRCAIDMRPEADTR